MSNSWDEMKRAKEDMYFEEQNKKALERIKERQGGKKRLSPVTGEPMEELTFMGVNVDRCPKSGGIWLDAGELEEILKNSKDTEKNKGWIDNFLSFITKPVK